MSKLSEVLSGLSAYYDKELNTSQLRIYVDLLADYPIDQVSAAAKKHMQDPDRGRFFPKVADLVAKMTGVHAMHISSDEAWAIALKSFDETQTVTWTNEIFEARNIALDIWNDGDKVGARMAFKAAYERIIQAAPPPKWQLCLGFDPAGRAEEMQRAVTAGLLPKPSHEKILMLNASVDYFDGNQDLLPWLNDGDDDSDAAREGKEKLRDFLFSTDEDTESKRVTLLKNKRDAIEERRQELLRQVEELAKG